MCTRIIRQALVAADPPEKLQQTCPTCPVLLSVDSPEAMNAAGITLDAYKRQSTLGAGLGVKKVTRAAAQVQKWLLLAGKQGSAAEFIAQQKIGCYTYGETTVKINL